MFAKIKNGTLTYLHDIRLLSPNSRKYLLGSFFIGMTFTAFMLLLNLYLRERGFSEGDIGSVLSSGALGMVVVSLPGAVLLSRIRLKPVLFISTLLSVVFGFLTIYTDNLQYISIFYFIVGAMMTFYRIAAGPFFMRNSTTRERPYLFSLSFGISVMGGVIGSVAFGKLVDFFATSFDYSIIEAHQYSLSLGILLSIVGLIPFALLKMPKKIPEEDRINFKASVILPLIKPIIKLASPYFIVGTGAGMIIPFLNLFFRDRFGLPADEIGFYFGIGNLTMFIGVMASPVLVKKIGMVRTMTFTQLASIPFMLVLAFSYNFELVIAAYLFRGALMNMGYPVGHNFAMEMMPKAFHGMINAILMFAWTSSWMVSTRVGGMIK